MTATKPTTTLCPVHMAGRSGPTTAANQEQQLFMLLAAPAPSPPRFATAREDVKARRGAGPPCTFRYARPILIHRQNPNHHQSEERGGFGTFGATLPSLGFEPTSAGRKRGMLPTVLRQDPTIGHGATFTHCPSTVAVQHQNTDYGARHAVRTTTDDLPAAASAWSRRNWRRRRCASRPWLASSSARSFPATPI